MDEEPVRIDGSYGEGGGQILRYALAIGAVLGKPVEVHNVRANRSKPGLRPQHLVAVKMVADLVDGRLEGAAVGSTQISLKPQKVQGGSFRYDIGTAGSVTLVIQTILPIVAFAPKETHVTLTGGTDVKWSPTSDYVQRVFLPTLQEFGVDASMSTEVRGYYPRGGGRVVLRVNPVEKLDATSLQRRDVRRAWITSHCANLPRHVALRQASSAEEVLKDLGVECEDTEVHRLTGDHAVGKGSAILVYSTEGPAHAGGDSIGEKGKPAEKVGREAAERYADWWESNASVDRFMADMLVPYAVMADGETHYTVPRLTGHLETALHVQEQVADAEAEVVQEEDATQVAIVGIAHSVH